MSVRTIHPDLSRVLPKYELVRTLLNEGEEGIKAKGTRYLPATSGMLKHWDKAITIGGVQTGLGRAHYDAYKQRATVHDTTQQAHGAIMGIAFAKDPSGELDEIVTLDGLSQLALSRELASDVFAIGRAVLVVDAPSDAGAAYIQQYPAEALINWRFDRFGNVLFAVLRETVPDESSDEFSHETVEQYRVYRRIAPDQIEVTLYNNGGAIAQISEAQDSVILPLADFPVIPIGSINCDFNVDPQSLLPVARLVLDAYRISADYKQALFLSGQPTPWASGIDDDLYNAIIEQGLGSSSLLNLGESGKVGYLEFGGANIGALKQAIDDALSAAAKHGIQLAHTAQEAAETVRMRMNMQQATVKTAIDAINEGMNKALRIRAKLNGDMGEPTEFVLTTDLSDQSTDPSMLTALNAIINAGNAPQSLLFNYARQSGLTTAEDDELREEIEMHSGGLSAPPSVKNPVDLDAARAMLEREKQATEAA